MPEDFFGLGWSKMGGAGVSGKREGEEVRFERVFLWMWVISPLAVSIGDSFRPGVVGLGGEGIVLDWEGSGVEFGQVFPCLEAVFIVEILLDDPFGT